MNYRFLNGHFEIEYQPVLKIVDGCDEKTVQHQLMDLIEGGEGQYDAGYAEGFDDGKKDGVQEGREELEGEIDTALDRLLDNGKISEETHAILCRELPTA